MTSLRRWWTKKYKRPVTCVEWGRYYIEDLVIEFLEDLFENDEEAARKVRLKHMGTELSPTGDPLIDMWERQVAQGLDPDLSACEDPRAKEFDRKIAEKARHHYEQTGEEVYIPEAVEAFSHKELHEGGGEDNDPLAFDFRDYLSGMDGGDVASLLENVPPEMFDQLVGAAGLLKK